MGIPGMPTRFTFKVLQNATDNFSRKLGAGAFGSVYEGVLPDKTRVAVKQLEFAQQGWVQFRAEVATIGSVSHVNLVHLHGFCIGSSFMSSWPMALWIGTCSERRQVRMIGSLTGTHGTK